MSLIPVQLCFVRKGFNKWIGSVSECCDKEMRIVNLSGFVIHHTWEFVAYPVYEQFLARFTLLWKDHFLAGSFPPVVVFGTEPAVTITIRMNRAVIVLPYVLEIDLAA